MELFKHLTTLNADIISEEVGSAVCVMIKFDQHGIVLN